MRDWLLTIVVMGQLTTAAAQAQEVAPVQAPQQILEAEAARDRVRSLREALSKTYANNPTLMAQRARVRTSDQDVAIVRASSRPQLTATGGLNQDIYASNAIGSNGRDLSFGAELSLPLFSGGQIRNAVRAADIRVEAARADLRRVEGEVFTEAVAAYANVILDREIVALNEAQVWVLETNLQAAQARFSVRDLTQTDVSQSEARLALARSTLATAQGQLQATEQNFLRVVGSPPGDLQPLPPLPPLPATADQAINIALVENPVLTTSAALARAAEFDVTVARRQRLPSVSAVTNTRYTNALGTADEANGVREGTLPNTSTNLGAGLSFRLPIYQGGEAGARIRRAEEVRLELVEQSIAVERLVVANAHAGNAIYRSALTAIAQNEVAVAANELALTSTRAEQTVGTRQILDVLNAEQELLNARVGLVTARRNAYVAGFQLLNIMGRAEAENLNLGAGVVYDPEVHYRRFSRSWSDWDAPPSAAPSSTRTVPANAESPITGLTGEAGSSTPIR